MASRIVVTVIPVVIDPNPRFGSVSRPTGEETQVCRGIHRGDRLVER